MIRNQGERRGFGAIWCAALQFWRERDRKPGLDHATSRVGFSLEGV